MAYDPDKIIEVATKLKAAREDVITWENELRRLVLGQHVLSISTVVMPDVSTPTRVVDLLNSTPDKEFSAMDVWKKLGIKESYARPLLSRLVTDGRIEKRGRGAYGAVGGSKQKSLDSVEPRPVQ
ncbi:MAG TPA: hypothetical protein VI386_05585 [Candidatus Sulfotelmatobacter sp.]